MTKFHPQVMLCCFPWCNCICFHCYCAVWGCFQRNKVRVTNNSSPFICATKLLSAKKNHNKNKIYEHKISKTQKERKKSNQWKLCFCKRVKDHPRLESNPWKESECVFLLFGQELLSLFYQVIVRSKHCQGDTDSAHQASEPEWLSVFLR